MASYSRDDAITLVYRMLRDVGDTVTEQLLTNTEIGQFVDMAARRYGRMRPRTVVEDLTPDGTAFTALPSGFEPETQSIIQIEWPTGNFPPTIIDQRYWTLYQAPDGFKLNWLLYTPGSTDTVRVTYTASRSFGADVASTTVLDEDFEAVCALAASYCATAIEAKFARTSDPILQADTVNYRTKQQEWAAVAKQWMQVWTDHAKSIVPPASGWANWDTKLVSGYDNMTHPRLRR